MWLLPSCIPPFTPVTTRRVTGLVWDLFFLSLDEPGAIFVRMHGCITRNLSKLFSETRVLYCFLPKSSIIEARRLDKMSDTNFSNLLESGCTQSDIFSSGQSGNHQFQDTHGKIELFAGMLHRMASRGQPLAVGVTLCDLAKEMGCEKNSPTDIEWSRIHEAKVHISHILLHVWEKDRRACQISGSHKCGKSVSNITETSQSELSGQLFFFIFSRATTNEITTSMNGYKKVKEKTDNDIHSRNLSAFGNSHVNDE